MDKILDKIKGDFFAIMAPGFYTLIILMTIAVSTIDNGSYFEWEKISKSFDCGNKYWPMILLGIFLSYLLGNFLRAIPVRIADKYCKKLFSWTSKNNDLVKIYYQEDFPYHTALSNLLENLRKNGFPEEIFYVPLPETVHTVYNYFKAVICSESPGAFSFTQALEARVRLFAGMFWSAFFGFVTCISLLYIEIFIKNIEVHGFVICLGVASLIIAGLLGGQLPRVRGQEVEYVFYSYLAFIAKSENKLLSGVKPINLPEKEN